MELQLESSTGLKKNATILFHAAFTFFSSEAAPPAQHASTHYTPGLVWRFVSARSRSRDLWGEKCILLTTTHQNVSDHAASVVARERHMPMLARCACNMSLRTAGGTRASRMGFGDDSVRT
jgi:hypothetical protein